MLIFGDLKKVASVTTGLFNADMGTSFLVESHLCFHIRSVTAHICEFMVSNCVCMRVRLCVCRRGTGMPTRSTCLKQWSSWGSSMPGGSWRSAPCWCLSECLQFQSDYLELRGSNTSYTGCICFWPELTSCLYFLRFLTGLSSCGFIYKAFIYTTQHEALSRLYLIAVLSLLCIPGCSSGCCFQPQV